MSKKIKVISKMAPKMVIEESEVGLKEIANYISERSTMQFSLVFNALKEVIKAVVDICMRGESVRLGEVGVIAPRMNLDGEMCISFKADDKLISMVNNWTKLAGKVQNRDNIGMSLDELFQIWNEEHPDDPVEM